MEEEIEELKEEISLLTKRVKILEGKDNKRTAFVYIKLLVKIIIILATIYGVYRGYDYLVKEVPKIIEEKIEEINIVPKKA